MRTKNMLVILAAICGTPFACSSSVDSVSETATTRSALVDSQTWAFESLSGWSNTGSVMALNAQHTQGTYSLGLSNVSNARITSVPSTIGAMGSTVSVDLQIPARQPNPYWYGAIQLLVDAPSAGLYSEYIGQRDLATLTPGQFGNVTFPVSSRVQSALSRGASDLRVTLGLNVPPGPGPYLFDNLQIGASTSAPPRKDPSHYTSRSVFLVSDQSWQDVLSLVPVATWTSDPAVSGPCNAVYDGPADKCAYPFLVYHQEGLKVDADAIVHFLQQYGPDNVAVFGNVPPELASVLNQPQPVGAGLAAAQLRSVTSANLLEHWQSYGSVVYAPNDYGAAMHAAVLAAHLNIPLIIQQSALDRPEVLAGKQLVCFGDVTAPTACARTLDVRQAQDLVFASGAPDKVVVANAKDLTLSVNEPLTPQKTSGPLQALYTKTSLMAPFVAAAKRELLLEAYDADSTQVDAFIDHEIVARMIHPTFLTIVGSPDAIAMTSTGTNTSTGATFHREVDNSLYGRGGSDRFQTYAVGRLMGVTLADVSTQIARTFFWNRLPLPNAFAVISPPSASAAEGLGFELPVRSTAYLLSQMGLVDGSVYLATPGSTFDPRGNLENKLIIDYNGHGSPGGWVNVMGLPTMRTAGVRFSPSIVINDACSTCDYGATSSPKSDLFCTNLLRQGAVATVGAVDVEGGVVGLSRNLVATLANHTSIGQALQRVKDLEVVQGCTDPANPQYRWPYCEPYFVLLGDPSFNPGFNFPTVPTAFSTTETAANHTLVTVSIPQATNIIRVDAQNTFYQQAPGLEMMQSEAHWDSTYNQLSAQAQFMLELSAPFTSATQAISAEFVDAAGNVTVVPVTSTDADGVNFAKFAAATRSLRLNYSTYNDKRGRYWSFMTMYLQDPSSIAALSPTYQIRFHLLPN